MIKKRAKNTISCLETKYLSNLPKHYSQILSKELQQNKNARFSRSSVAFKKSVLSSAQTFF